MRLGYLLIGLTAAVLSMSVLLYVTRSTDATEKLCVILGDLIVKSDATMGQKGTPGYVYFKEHPEELTAAHAQNKQFLDGLPCVVKR